MDKIVLIVFCALVVVGMVAAELLFCREPKKKKPQSDDEVKKDEKN